MRIIDLQKVTAALGYKLCVALIGLHVFTGCDTTSAFYGKGKKRALDIASKNDHFLDAFCQLGSSFTLTHSTVAMLESFVCKLYGQQTEEVNEARYKLFCLSSPSERSLPPTKDSLNEHCKRCNYQAAIHRNCLGQYICEPSPTDHGWKMTNNQLMINWSTTDQVPAQLLKFIHCSCQTGKCDSGRCSCLSAKLPCTDYCKCTHIMCNNRDITVTNNSDSTDEDSELMVSDSDTDSDIDL